MANLIIPFSVREIDANVPYFLVMKIPFSSFMAYLSSDCLYLRDSTNINHKVYLKISRSQESLKIYGPNQWMQYIDRFHICFGTKSGLVNVLRLTDLTAYSKNFGNVFFASIFNCFKHLAYITPNKELFFIKIDNDTPSNTNNDPFQDLLSRKSPISQTINITELKYADKTIELLPVNYDFNFSTTTISNTIFCHRLNKPKLAAIIQDKPCLIPFTPSALKTRKAIQPIYFLIDDPTLIAVNPTYEYIAAAKNDGSIVFMSLNYPDSNPILISKFETGAQIIFMRWTHDDENLIVVASNGCVVLFEMPTYTVYNIYVPDLLIPTANMNKNDTNNLNNVNGHLNNNNNSNNTNNNTNNLTNSINPKNETLNEMAKSFSVCRIVSIDYDEESKCFFVVKREDEDRYSLHAIEFATIHKRFSFTVSHVFDNLTKINYPLKIFPIKNVIPFSIKEKIRDLPNHTNTHLSTQEPQLEQSTKLFISASINQIQIDDHVLTFNDDDIIQGLQFLEGILFVFIFSTKEEQTRLLLFDENLNQKRSSIIFSITKEIENDNTDLAENIESIKFPHSVHSITSNYINQLAISCHTMYTLITMNTKSYKKPSPQNENDVDLFEGLNLDDNNAHKKKNKYDMAINAMHIQINSPEFESILNSNDDDNYTFSIKTYSVRNQLKSAVSCLSQTVFLHYTNGKGQFIDSKYTFNNIKYAFYEPYSDIVVVQMPHTYYIVKDSYQAEFKGIACFSDMVETFSLQKLSSFGEINYIGTLFMPFLLINNFNESNSLLISRLKKLCPNIERFDNILTSTVSTAFIQNHPSENINDNVRPIINSIPPERAAIILQNAIDKIKTSKTNIKIIPDSSSYSGEEESSSSSDVDEDNNDESLELVKQLLLYDFNWEKCFKYFTLPTKELILEYLKPIELENLLLEIDNDTIDETNFSSQEKKDFLIKLIKKFHFLRAFKISESFKVNFPSLIKEVFYQPNSDSNQNPNLQIDLKKIIKKIHIDKREFNMKDDNGLLRFMGSTFGASNLFIFSFAVFLVLKEQSKIELMLMTNADSEIDKIITDYVKTNPESKYTKFLLSLPNSMFKAKI